MANSSYSTGNVTVADNGTTVTGIGTIWSGVNAKAGDKIYIDGLGAVDIKDVTDTTHLTLWSPWLGGAKTSRPYTIVQDYPVRVVGVAAAADVGDMLAQLNSLGPIFNVPSTATVPDPSYGADGQYAIQMTTGKWWLKTAGVWTLTTAPIAGYGGTSATSLVIANSVTRVFTTQANLAYNGARVRAASAAAPTNYMEGVCTYSGSTLTMVVDAIGGSGTKADWVFAIAGQPGGLFTQSGTGAVTRSVSSKIGEFVGVKDFGVAGDGVAVTATITISSGSPNLLATGASFTAADVGKAIYVPGAGASGAVLSTTILTFTDATHVVLAANASTTVTATSKKLVYGTDDYANINVASAAARAAIKTLTIPDGIYLHSGTFAWAYSRFKVIALGENVTFLHTGTGVAHDFNGLTHGDPSQGVFRGVFGGAHRIQLRGNPAGGTTKLVYVCNWHAGDMKITGRDAQYIFWADNAPAAPTGSSAVSSNFDIQIGANHDGVPFSIVPDEGVHLDSCNACTFPNLISEDATNYGLRLVGSCGGNTFFGGVTESIVATGARIESGCVSNSFYGFDSEGNNTGGGTGKDWIIEGSRNAFYSCSGAGTTPGSTLSGSNNIFVRSSFQSLTISSGAVTNTFETCQFLTAFTDSGTLTTLRNLSGGLGILDKIPFRGAVSNSISQNADTSFLVANPSTGVSARSVFQASNDVTSSTFGMSASTYTDRILLANRAFIESGGSASGVVLSALGVNPIVFGINNIEVGRFVPATGMLNSIAGFTGGTFNGLAIASTDNSWQTPTFSAGDFTASGSMTWTVAAGDVTTYAYNIRGKVMTVSWVLATTTVGGTLSPFLFIKIPAGKTATKRMANPCFGIDNNVITNVRCEVLAGATNIQVLRQDAANWAASTDLTYIYGQITFEIN